VEVAIPNRPTYGRASVILGVIAVVVPAVTAWIIMAAAGARMQDQSLEGWDDFFRFLFGLIAAVAALVVASFVGVIAAGGGVITGIAGLVRGERRRWLSIVGLVLSGGFLVMWLLGLVAGGAPGPGN
jgi:hypothetical protein